MSKYQMDGGTVVDTAKASQVWEESSNWDGHNFISVNTGSQWEHQTLYRSRKGRYYIEHDSAYQQGRSHCEWVSEYEATRWLILNKKELPEELKQYEDEISE